MREFLRDYDISKQEQDLKFVVKVLRDCLSERLNNLKPNFWEEYQDYYVFPLAKQNATRDSDAFYAFSAKFEQMTIEDFIEYLIKNITIFYTADTYNSFIRKIFRQSNEAVRRGQLVNPLNVMIRGGASPALLIKNGEIKEVFLNILVRDKITQLFGSRERWLAHETSHIVDIIISMLGQLCQLEDLSKYHQGSTERRLISKVFNEDTVLPIVIGYMYIDLLNIGLPHEVALFPFIYTLVTVLNYFSSPDEKRARENEKKYAKK